MQDIKGLDLIEVMKVTSDGSNGLALKKDTISKRSIVSFRGWVKTQQDEWVKGPITVVFIKSPSATIDQPIRIKIAEDETLFRDRILDTSEPITKLRVEPDGEKAV